MYGYRGGRGGPSRSTPASVQCQKCLKRGHYSFECKISAQERPYASRPSRSQQLRNPKLAPKLTETKPPIEDKKGIADQELAKREAERERKREAEEREDRLIRSESRSRRSPSVDSVSTISTKASADSPPPPRRGRRDSYGSQGDGTARDIARDERRSRSPQRGRRSLSRDDPSPRREATVASYRNRDTVAPKDSQDQHRSKRRRRYSTDSQSPEVDDRPLSPSQSPRRRVDDAEEANQRQAPRHHQHSNARSNDRGGGRNGHGAREKRERSLSPFSQRRAMTNAMQSGGR